MCVFVPRNVKDIKPRRMNCDANVALHRKTNRYKILIGKYERKRPFGRRKFKWELKIKMSLRESQCKFVTWTELAQVAVASLLKTWNCV